MKQLIQVGVLTLACCVCCKKLNAQTLTFDSLQQIEPAEKGRVWKAFKAPLKLTLAGLFTATNNGIIDKWDIQYERNANFSNFHCTADDYIQYAPILAVYGLNLAGVKGENNLKNLTLILVKTELMVGALSLALKETTYVRRPDTGARTSFPSGHSAQAFAVATVMAKEYGKQSVWYSISAYTMASSVAAMRVLNDRHWISDVLVGAGIGVLSANVVYLTHKSGSKRKKKSDRITFVPGYGGFFVSYKI